MNSFFKLTLMIYFAILLVPCHSSEIKISHLPKQRQAVNATMTISQQSKISLRYIAIVPGSDLNLYCVSKYTSEIARSFEVIIDQEKLDRYELTDYLSDYRPYVQQLETNAKTIEKFRPNISSNYQIILKEMYQSPDVLSGITISNIQKERFIKILSICASQDYQEKLAEITPFVPGFDFETTTFAVEKAPLLPLPSRPRPGGMIVIGGGMAGESQPSRPQPPITYFDFLSDALLN